MSAIIRPATLADVAVLASLHGQCFDEPWDEAAFRGLLDRPGAFALLAGIGSSASESQSFILVQIAGIEAEILSLGTLPAARRLGLARAILARAMEEARLLGASEMFLEVAEDNRPALALYRNAGFSAAGRRPRYYQRGRDSFADALTLRAPIAG